MAAGDGFDWETERLKVADLFGDERHGRVATNAGEAGTMTSVEGSELKTWVWPVAEPKALVLLVHGYNHYTVRARAWGVVAWGESAARLC
jgi:hypothetical protein